MTHESLDLFSLRYEKCLVYVRNLLTACRDVGLRCSDRQLAIADSVCQYCNVLRREGGCDMRGALEFVVDGQSKKRRSRGMRERG